MKSIGPDLKELIQHEPFHPVKKAGPWGPCQATGERIPLSSYGVSASSKPNPANRGLIVGGLLAVPGVGLGVMQPPRIFPVTGP